MNGDGGGDMNGCGGGHDDGDALVDLGAGAGAVATATMIGVGRSLGAPSTYVAWQSVSALLLRHRPPPSVLSIQSESSEAGSVDHEVGWRCE